LTDFAELAGNLLTLEINTILKDGMSAQKMPTPANALIDVVQNYHTFLCKHAREFGALGRVQPGWADAISRSFDWGLSPFPISPGAAARASDPEFLQTTPDSVNPDSLHNIREIAVWLREMRDRTVLVAQEPDSGGLDLPPRTEADVREVVSRLQPEDDAVLSRIRRNCDQLKSLVGQSTITRQSRMQLAGDDVLMLRKVWELSTEIIIMQTVIQIDGDVVTRVQRGRDDARSGGLHAAHQEAVATSFRHWRYLVRTMAQLAGTTIRSLLR
jgi:hypothetical protein